MSLPVAIIVPRRGAQRAIDRARSQPVMEGDREVAGLHLDPITIRSVSRTEVRADWFFEPFPPYPAESWEKV